MKQQTRVVVIGGGIAGCSTLYHLTQEGWTDVTLVERDDLADDPDYPINYHHGDGGIRLANSQTVMDGLLGGLWDSMDGDIACKIVVDACGYRVNEVGSLIGVHHPVMSMEHQYFLTEPIPELEALDYRVPLLRCPIDDFYSRQGKKAF